MKWKPWGLLKCWSWEHKIWKKKLLFQLPKKKNLKRNVFANTKQLYYTQEWFRYFLNLKFSFLGIWKNTCFTLIQRFHPIFIIVTVSINLNLIVYLQIWNKKFETFFSSQFFEWSNNKFLEKSFMWIVICEYQSNSQFFIAKLGLLMKQSLFSSWNNKMLPRTRYTERVIEP